MLVLSRRENDRIVFPTLGITVEVMKLSRTRASIGVFAPKGIRVIRQELLADKDREPSTEGLAAAIRQEFASSIESEICHATGRLKAAQEELLGGNTDDALTALGQALNELERLREAAARNKTIDSERSEHSSFAGGVAEPAASYANSAVGPATGGFQVHSSPMEFEVNRSSDAMLVFYDSSNREKPDAVLLMTSLPNDDGEPTIRLSQHYAQS